MEETGGCAREALRRAGGGGVRLEATTVKVGSVGGGGGGDGDGGGGSGDGSGCRWCWRFKGDILNGWFSRRTRLPLVLSNTVPRLAAPCRFARNSRASERRNCEKELCPSVISPRSPRLYIREFSLARKGERKERRKEERKERKKEGKSDLLFAASFSIHEKFLDLRRKFLKWKLAALNREKYVSDRHKITFLVRNDRIRCSE